MRVAKITYPDFNNGSGCRATVWFRGCDIHCKGCHNQELWFLKSHINSNDVEKQLYEILSLPYIKGITLSGGDPFFFIGNTYPNFGNMRPILYKIKKDFPDKDIWLYTGRSIEWINHYYPVAYDLVDYIVTDPFEIDKKDLTLAFRGSSNQRIFKVENKTPIEVTNQFK